MQQRGTRKGVRLGGSLDAGKLRVRSTVKFTSSPLFQVSSSNFRDALKAEVENNENRIGRSFDPSTLSKCLYRVRVLLRITRVSHFGEFRSWMHRCIGINSPLIGGRNLPWASVENLPENVGSKLLCNTLPAPAHGDGHDAEGNLHQATGQLDEVEAMDGMTRWGWIRIDESWIFSFLTDLVLFFFQFAHEIFLENEDHVAPVSRSSDLPYVSR